MPLLDWIIVILPVTFILWAAVYSRRYIRGVVDFLAAGRVAGRYVISVGDLTTSLVVIAGYVMLTFSWGKEVAPVMLDRVPGENFLNPFDIAELRDPPLSNTRNLDTPYLRPH